MFVNLNPKGRRLPTKLVSPARRWARGPKCKRRLPGGSQCIASDKRPGSRLQAYRLQTIASGLGLLINFALGRVETPLVVRQHTA